MVTTTVKKVAPKKVATKTATTKKTTEKVERKQTEEQRDIKAEALRKRKLFTDDLGILVFDNAGNTELIYSSDKTGNKYVMRYGDTEWLTYAEVKEMKSRHRGILENYLVKIIDVDSDDLTVEDVLKSLGLDRIYDEEIADEDDINMLLNSVPADNFKAYIENTTPEYLQRILDVALQQAVDGGFNDANKRSILEKVTERPDIFKDIIDKNN